MSQFPYGNHSSISSMARGAAPRRFNATAGAARAADKAGDRMKARAYAMQLREIANNAETSRPELEWARVYLAGN